MHAPWNEILGSRARSFPAGRQGSAVAVAILPSRGPSPEAAAEGAGAANSPPSVPGAFTGPSWGAEWCPAWGESVERPVRGKSLVKEVHFPLNLLFLHFCSKQLWGSVPTGIAKIVPERPNNKQSKHGTTPPPSSHSTGLDVANSN